MYFLKTVFCLVCKLLHNLVLRSDKLIDSLYRDYINQNQYIQLLLLQELGTYEKDFSRFL